MATSPKARLKRELRDMLSPYMNVLKRQPEDNPGGGEKNGQSGGTEAA